MHTFLSQHSGGRGSWLSEFEGSQGSIERDPVSKSQHSSKNNSLICDAVPSIVAEGVWGFWSEPSEFCLAASFLMLVSEGWFAAKGELASS